MIAARDGLCPYKGPDRRLLPGVHKDTASKLRGSVVMPDSREQAFCAVKSRLAFVCTGSVRSASCHAEENLLGDNAHTGGGWCGWYRARLCSHTDAAILCRVETISTGMVIDRSERDVGRVESSYSGWLRLQDAVGARGCGPGWILREICQRTVPMDEVLSSR